MKIFNILFYPILIFSLFLIKLYKWIISPFMQHTCRFYPTCSTYSYQALKSFGIIKGTKLAIKRIFKCSPLSKGGYDPIPQNIKGDSKWII